VLAAGKTRLLIGALLLGVGIFVAGWALASGSRCGLAKSEEVATAVHKLLRGELLREVRPPQRDDAER
jgi:hypothetical protein